MATLTTSEILQLTLDAIRVQCPALSLFSTDFSSQSAKKGETIYAHISTLPAVQSYDATTGFKANAAEASTLLTDVPVTLDQFKHVPVKVDFLDQISSRKDLLTPTINNAAYVLGKSIVDFALGKIVAANFTRKTVETIANTTKATLDAVTLQLNTQGAMPMGRAGLVNSPFFNALESDARIASGDYYGQRRAGNGYGKLTNVSGFENVLEYPDMPANSENLTGFFFDKRAVAVASRMPTDVQTVAAKYGIPQVMKFEAVSDPDSGLTLLGVFWQEQGSGDLYFSPAVLYGASAGARGGAADSSTDKSGHRVVTA